MPLTNIVKNKGNLIMFEEFSDHARIWIFGFKEKLSDEDIKIVSDELDCFILNWNSHKKPVKGDYEILYDRFVILVAEPSLSGCSIDSSINVLRKLNNEHNLDALNQDLVYYRDSNGISALSRDYFQKLVDEDKISLDTTVYDMTPTMLGVFRAGQWELPFSKSWHGQVFKKSA